jgi:hypothetical protein
VKETNAKHILMIAALLALLAVPVMAGTPNQDGTCIVPPDDYFVKDGAGNGQPAHEGVQLGYVFWIPDTNQDHYTAGGYLGITEFKLKQSHEEQIKIAMGKYWYCDSIPDVPYGEQSGRMYYDYTPDTPKEAPQFTSEDPKKSVYLVQHASRPT